MKNLKTVVNERPEYEKLIRAVVRNIGIDSVEDVNNHGIDGGFNGFIYTRDTVQFFRRHRADILALAKDSAEQLGEDVLSMIASFGCLSDSGRHGGKPQYSPTEIAAAIYGRPQSLEDGESDMILNALAWFAAEEVCRMFED